MQSSSQLISRRRGLMSRRSIASLVVALIVLAVRGMTATGMYSVEPQSHAGLSVVLASFDQSRLGRLDLAPGRKYAPVEIKATKSLYSLTAMYYKDGCSG